eukprot:5057607-Prymnesium_polylepis.1
MRAAAAAVLPVAVASQPSPQEHARRRESDARSTARLHGGRQTEFYQPDRLHTPDSLEPAVPKTLDEPYIVLTELRADAAGRTIDGDKFGMLMDEYTAVPYYTDSGVFIRSFRSTRKGWDTTMVRETWQCGCPRASEQTRSAFC